MSEKNPNPANETSIPRKEILEEDKVVLKPFWGIRPGHYLAVIYGAVILLALFFILLYPGISKPGSVLVVKSEPHGAAVLVDGVYMDAAPCEIFVPKGSRNIELVLPGFSPKSVTLEIKGRLFASVLFPIKVRLAEKLESPDAASAFTGYAREYAAWAFTGEPTTAYQVPLILSEGAYRLGPLSSDPAILKSMKDTIATSTRFAVTQASLRDLVRAKTLVDNQGLSPSPLSLLSSAEDIIDFIEDNPRAVEWLSSVLTGEAKSALVASSWYKDYADHAGASSSAGEAGSRPTLGSSLQAGLLSFRMINPPQAAQSQDRLQAFFICETVISPESWERFLLQRSMWRPDNKPFLIQEGLVSDDYLSPGIPRGLSFISWHAAKAYCEWLSTLLPVQYASWEVRLPTEAEWEYAARAGALDSGTFWEWCEDPYSPLSYLKVPVSSAEGLGSDERSLKGGAWINPAGTVEIETRGALPPSFCSAFVSARPVIAPKRN